MARNVEIKARVGDPAALERRVALLATDGPDLIEQDDTFFTCPNGRLKLRVLGSGEGQLVFYRRSDTAGPKESFYVVSTTPEPDSLREALTHAYGSLGRVIKRRTLYMVGRTRIHLDAVKDLGNFLELEVVLAEDEPVEAGIAEADALLRRLDISADSLIDRAYFDLLADSSTTL
ncbi:class IV adenylate cyclase [Lacibacterium aquatile]|uniref:Class IV adenylate cyclase n=1 Tax=Lacibacterium aquatile TaxID=1168082 RepID=A0ABW5DRA5_9PROT